MRRTVIAGVVLGFVVLTTTGTALAAPPEVQQKSCEADQGTFERDHGVKTCTTTSTHSFTSSVIPSSVSAVDAYQTGIRYEGTYTLTYEVQTTTTESQKGNGPVTSTESSTVLSTTVNEISCTGVILFGGVVISTSTLPLAECEAAGVFPPH